MFLAPEILTNLAERVPLYTGIVWSLPGPGEFAKKTECDLFWDPGKATQKVRHRIIDLPRPNPSTAVLRTDACYDRGSTYFF